MTQQTSWSNFSFKFLAILIFACTCSIGYSQDPERFQDEVEKLVKKYSSVEKNVVVFTGSSSIRRWDNLEEQFSKINIVKTGFGGSHMSDLLHYADELILQYSPQKIFIYEGDNDLNDGESPESILKETQQLFKKIREELPSATIFFISPKPSPARWSLKDKYLKFNQMLQAFADGHSNTFFIDVWPAMLNSDRQPKKEIFVSDNLHMNELGYELWATEIKKHLE